MSTKTVAVEEVRDALQKMGYHKTELFINRLIVNEDNETEFSVDTVKDVAFQMLDFNYEENLLNNLGISK